MRCQQRRAPTCGRTPSEATHASEVLHEVRLHRSTLALSKPLAFARASIKRPDGSVVMQPRVANIMKTAWGELFRNYGDGKVWSRA